MDNIELNEWIQQADAESLWNPKGCIVGICPRRKSVEEEAAREADSIRQLDKNLVAKGDRNPLHNIIRKYLCIRLGCQQSFPGQSLEGIEHHPCICCDNPNVPASLRPDADIFLG